MQTRKTWKKTESYHWNNGRIAKTTANDLINEGLKWVTYSWRRLRSQASSKKRLQRLIVGKKWNMLRSCNLSKNTQTGLKKIVQHFTDESKIVFFFWWWGCVWSLHLQFGNKSYKNFDNCSPNWAIWHLLAAFPHVAFLFIQLWPNILAVMQNFCFFSALFWPRYNMIN